MGALASFALIGFIDPVSIGVGLGVIVVTAGWHVYYARDVTLRGAL